MNDRLVQKKIIPIIVGVIIVVAIVSVIYFNDIKNPDETKSQWISSGPFAISKSQYKLGENVFMTVHGLKPIENGQIVFILPSGKPYVTIPFNGTLKTDFNYYFKPDTSAQLKIYSPQDLVGTWRVVFQGVAYKPISFEFINEFMPGEENDIVPIPTG